MRSRRNSSEASYSDSRHNSSEASDSDGSDRGRQAINTIFTTKRPVSRKHKGSTDKGRRKPRDSPKSYVQAVTQAPCRQKRNERQKAYHSGSSSAGRSSKYRTRVFHSRTHRNEYSDVSSTSSESSGDDYHPVTWKSHNHHRPKSSGDVKARTKQTYGHYSSF